MDNKVQNQTHGLEKGGSFFCEISFILKIVLNEARFKYTMKFQSYTCWRRDLPWALTLFFGVKNLSFLS